MFVDIEFLGSRWVSFKCFAKACCGKFFYSGFLLFSEQQGFSALFYTTTDEIFRIRN